MDNDYFILNMHEILSMKFQHIESKLKGCEFIVHIFLTSIFMNNVNLKSP
jgi:hypothetical protein